MKRIFLPGFIVLIAIVYLPQYSSAQSGNAGIGTNSPTSKLTIQTPLNTTGFTHLGATASNSSDSLVLPQKVDSATRNIGINTTTPANTLQIGSLGSAGFAGNAFAIGDGANDGLSLNQTSSIAQLASSTDITFAPQKGIGNVGINVLNPQNTFQIGDVNYGGYLFSAGSNGNSFAFLQTSGVTQLSSTTNISLIPTGNVGINTNNPTNSLQVGSMGSTGFAGNAFALGNGTNATTMNQDNNIIQLASSTNISLAPQKGTGSVGINVLYPANTLQIGSVGNSGYAGNAFAIGNGTNALGINQGNSFAQLSSNTDITLAPQNGNGRVGINTSTPRAPLDVEGSASEGHSYNYYKRGNINYEGECINCTAIFSIYTSSSILALEFDAYSDARIKNIIGATNTTNDLQTLNKIQVTNYTFKDQIAKGNKTYKKVIAQQVEKIYPQVVSKHVDFVPNVYQLTNKIEKITDGYLLSFPGNHHISKDAKKLQVIMDDNSNKKDFDIISIPSSSQVIIKAEDLKRDKLFVYGEEVNDFRTVDYEGLTTLNISATQEISKQVTQLKKTIAAQNKKIDMLMREMVLIKQRPVMRSSQTHYKHSQ